MLLFKVSSRFDRERIITPPHAFFVRFFRWNYPLSPIETFRGRGCAGVFVSLPLSSLWCNLCNLSHGLGVEGDILCPLP